MGLDSCLNCIRENQDYDDTYYDDNETGRIDTTGCPQCPSGIIPSYLKPIQVIRYIKAYKRRHECTTNVLNVRTSKQTR